jgi:hypothetical protein
MLVFVTVHYLMFWTEPIEDPPVFTIPGRLPRASEQSCRVAMKRRFPQWAAARKVIVSRPRGRFGNNFYQLTRALFVADLFNIDTVVLPFGLAGLKHDFTTTRNVRVRFRSAWRWRMDFWLGWGYRLLHGCDSLRLNYFTEKDVWEACDPPLDAWAATWRPELARRFPAAPIPNDTVLVSIRSGDIWKKWFPGRLLWATQYPMPPCQIYKEAIALSGAQRVIIATEVADGALANPCTRILMDDLPNVTVAARTGVSAAVSMMVSERGLVMSRSSMEEAAFWLNPNRPVFAFNYAAT